MASYFIYGYYGFGNFGDDLLLDVMIAQIRQRDREASFLIRARQRVKTLENDPAISFLLCESILENGEKSRLSKFVEYRSTLMEAARKCDVFIVGGGTLFIDKGQLNWSLLFVHEAIRAAKNAGRRVVVTGVAIDILAHPVSLWLTRRIFQKADFAAVRDALSLAYFPDWKSPPQLSADLAWLKPLPLIPPSIRDRKVVGLNFIDYFRSSTRSSTGHVRLIQALRGIVNRHRGQFDFHLIALQKGIGQRDDWFAEEFSSLVPEGRVIYIDGEGSLLSALESVDAIITTRFHLALLAARAGVATCVIDHELKLTSLVQELSLPSISLSEFIAPDAPDPIDRLAGWRPEQTLRAVERVSKRARVNFGWMPE